jgi:hypothetical protein
MDDSTITITMDDMQPIERMANMRRGTSTKRRGMSTKRIGTSTKRIGMSTKRIGRSRTIMSTDRMYKIATRNMSNKMAKRIGRSLTSLNERSKNYIARYMPNSARNNSARNRYNIARKKTSSTSKRNPSIDRISAILASRIAMNKRKRDNPAFQDPSFPDGSSLDQLIPVPPPQFPGLLPQVQGQSPGSFYSGDSGAIDITGPLGGPIGPISPTSPSEPGAIDITGHLGGPTSPTRPTSPTSPSEPGDSEDPASYTKGTVSKPRAPPLYSVTSDHKPIFMIFDLQGIRLTGFCYNMSFVSDLGPINPYGSEKFFLEQIKGTDKREYWKNAAKLVKHFFDTQAPDIMFFQEMNDRDNITPRNGGPNSFDPATGQFLGGFQALLELLNGGPITIGPPVTTNCYPPGPLGSPSSPGSPGSPGSVGLLGSYYRTGTFGSYCFVSFSVRKQMFRKVVYPTVLTIWKNTPESGLGAFADFYGNDIGLHVNYYSGDGFHSGRNFSFVRTTTHANLLNLHGPNAAQVIDTRLRPVISEYMQTAISDLGGTYNGLATVIGGDFNDSDDLLREIVLTRSARERYIYSYRGIAPRTCCTEYPSDTIDKPYRGAGDKIFVIVPFTTETAGPLFNRLLYYIQLFIPLPQIPPILYGGFRNRSHSLGFNNKKKSRKLQSRKPRRYTHKIVTKHYKTKY